MRFKNRIFVFIVCCQIFSISLFAANTIEGFYCNVFQDEGTSISGGNLEIDCEYINFSQEHLDTRNDKEFQSSIMVQSETDANGYLLYPDGSPRYAIIYYHGGHMKHAEELGQQGRDQVRMHYYRGGCQFGSCAGSYMLANNKKWFNIWPGRMNGKNVSSTPTDKIINAGSPLIGYNDLKEGEIIKGVYHNNGGSVDTSKSVKGTLFGAMHNSGKLAGYADIWTWSDNDTTGRVLGITGHPEGSKKKDQIRYISACMLYLADCLAKPRIKHTLKNNTAITMDKKWEDKQPLFTKIGDKQYHHFILDCKDARKVGISVEGEEGFDLHLFVSKDTFALKQQALFADSTPGNSKVLEIPKLEPGTWYVGVKLNTTVTTTSNKTFPKYSGKLEVLNGIAYTIKAKWEMTPVLASQVTIQHQYSKILNYRKVLINTGSAVIKSLKIFDLKGRLCYNPLISKNNSQFLWQANSSGAYVIQIVSARESLQRQITLIK